MTYKSKTDILIEIPNVRGECGMFDKLIEHEKLKSLFVLKPMMTFPRNVKVFGVNKINMDTFTEEELMDLQNRIVASCYKLEPAVYKFITIGRPGYLKYPRTNNKLKNQFIREMEDYINKVWNIRQRKSYLMTPKNINEKSLIGEFTYPSVNLFTPNKELELKEDLAYLFGGTVDQPFEHALYDHDKDGLWDYGFVTWDGRYGLVMINYGVGESAVPFGNDFLNYIDSDFLHLLHFQSLNSVEIERKIKQSLVLAEKTHMPDEMIMELKDLEQSAILGKGNITQFMQVLILFGDNKEKLLEYAYKVKSMSPYVLGFEGDIEFELTADLLKMDLLKGKETFGVIRTSTIDYVATLFPISGRFTGVPQEPYIPMLNENLEPAYIPIDKSLFNLGTQGQMGAGKSVSLQYIATFFDAVIFVEKIQSDMGSYAVYAKYFDGDYIPLSLEIPVSINPLGKPADYYTADVYKLVEACGVRNAYVEYDDGEREKLAMVIDDYLEQYALEHNNTPKTVLTKQELVELASQDSYLVRFLELFKKLPDDFSWNVKLMVNSAKKVFINTVIAFMYKGEDKDMNSEEKAIIEKYIDGFYQKAFKENPYQDVTISMLYDHIYLSEETPIKQKLLSRLYSFKEGGRYGHLFDAKTNIEEKDTAFFEVRFNEAELIPIVMISIMDHINKHFGSLKYKGKSKLVVIDEGWFFMQNELAKNFIDEAFRTYRKRGISIAFGTQNPKDYITMLNYLPYIWILYLENPSEAVQVYSLTDRDFEHLKSIDKPKAYGYKYSKTFLKFKNMAGKTEKGLFILPSYPAFRWIAETDPVFKLQREEATRKAGSLRGGIKLLAFGE